jgi:hypothetical protein
MDNTVPCSTFGTRSNARRAAEKMITAGTASEVDYGIKPRDDGRFEIAWKSSPTTDAKEEESTLAAGETCQRLTAT